MKSIGVVTVGRSDYSIYLPILRALTDYPTLRFSLLVSGTHLAPEHGRTLTHIERHGFPISARIDMQMGDDSPLGISMSMSHGVAGFGAAYAKSRPDILLVLGDRFEMLSAVVAAIPFDIPVAHLHGGEITEGANDELMRHAITKMSHLHFVSTETYAKRILQMGEESWRVTVSGAPSLDNLRDLQLMGREEIGTRLGLALDKPPILVTYHPVTLGTGTDRQGIEELLATLESVDQPIIFTAPNSDSGGKAIKSAIEEFCSGKRNARLVASGGPELYFSLMAHSAAMVGNSSSGIIEAPSFELPVVNIGDRQKGRLQAANVINCAPSRESIREALSRATDPNFKRELAGKPNPYGDGNAAERIVQALDRVSLNRELTRKQFVDIKS